jgi:beta-lactamase class D
MRTVLVLFLLSLSFPVQALNWTPSADVTRLFIEAGVDGTFVLYDVEAERFIGHDRLRAQTRFVPGSTFKIANSLIGLAVGSVKDVDEVLPYGGAPQPFKQWQRDMGLREAIAISNVPIFQELARRTGLQAMADNVAQIGYGNSDIGATVDRFWLDGPLQISAIEQTRFLARLAQGALPYPESIQRAVRDIVLLENTGRYRLHGKTGWVNAPGPGVGWWVGWVEHERGLYAFAINVDIRSQVDADKRIPLAKGCLKALGVL